LNILHQNTFHAASVLLIYSSFSWDFGIPSLWLHGDLSSLKLETCLRFKVLLVPWLAFVELLDTEYIDIKYLCFPFCYSQPHPNYCNNPLWLMSKENPLEFETSSKVQCHLLVVKLWSVWFWVLPVGEIQLRLWFFRCDSCVEFILRF
jgi:hypothetical protein